MPLSNNSLSKDFRWLPPAPALQVSRAGYYAWLSAVESARDQQDRELMPFICDIFWQHKRRYGARRIAVEMQARGRPCGVERVAKLLKIQGLQAIQPQSYRPQTHRQPACPGLQPQPPAKVRSPRAAQSSLGRRHHLHPLEGICLCLSGLGTRSVFAPRRRLESRRADDRNADPRFAPACHPDRQPSPGLVHHSDRGGQYAGHGGDQTQTQVELHRSRCSEKHRWGVTKGDCETALWERSPQQCRGSIYESGA